MMMGTQPKRYIMLAEPIYYDLLAAKARNDDSKIWLAEHPGALSGSKALRELKQILTAPIYAQSGEQEDGDQDG